MGRPKKIIEQTSFATPVVASDSIVYGIKSIGVTGVVGWIMDDKLNVATYPTLKKAQKALQELLKDSRYFWNCTIEVAPFAGFDKQEV